MPGSNRLMKSSKVDHVKRISNRTEIWAGDSINSTYLLTPLPVISQRPLADPRALPSISVKTAWRMARTGQLLAPVRLTAGTTRWRVGAIRVFLSAAPLPAASTRGRREDGGAFTPAA